MSSIPQQKINGEEIEGVTCPECNGKMLWRNQKRNPQNWFMGCARFPRCAGVREESGIASSAGYNNRVHNLLKAAILAADDEVLILYDEHLSRVHDFQIKIEPVADPERPGYVVTLVRKP